MPRLKSNQHQSLVDALEPQGRTRDLYKRYHADRPLKDPKDDCLGLAPYAHELADFALNVDLNEGFVVALTGEWGSGKSSVINMALKAIKERNTDNETKPVVIQFSPWQYPTDINLIPLFFSQLCVRLSIESPHKIFADAISLIKKFGKAISFLTLAPGISGAAATVLSTTVSVTSSLDSVSNLLKKDVNGLKEKIEDKLRRSQKRIIVVLDDIDRLTAEEIQKSFQLVKAVANFPNILYILVFDRKVVNTSLNELTAGHGDEFTKKIAQITFTLPKPSRAAFFSLIEKELRQAFHLFLDGDQTARTDLADDGLTSKTIQRSTWSNELTQLITPFIRTPRNLRRLINSINLFPNQLMGELNSIDLVLLMVIQEFHPQCYDHIWRNRDSLVGERGSTLQQLIKENGPETENLAWKTIQGIPTLENQRELQSLRDILDYLFPISRTQYLKKADITSLPTARWRSQNRACSREHFDIYFTRSISFDGITNSMVHTFLASISDQARSTTFLKNFMSNNPTEDNSRAIAFLERIFDRTEDFTIENRKYLLSALMSIGAEFALLPKKDPIDSASWAPFQVCLRLIRQHPNKLDWDQLTEQLWNTLYDIADKVSFTQYLGYWYEKYDAGNQAVLPSICSEGLLKKLEDATLLLIEQEAAKDSIISSDQLFWILKRWRDWSKSDVGPRGAIKRWAADDQKLCEVIFRGLLGNQVITSSPTDWQGSDTIHSIHRETLIVNVRAFDSLFQLSSGVMQNRLSSILQSQPEWLTPERKLFLERLIPVLQEVLSIKAAAAQTHRVAHPPSGL